VRDRAIAVPAAGAGDGSRPDVAADVISFVGREPAGAGDPVARQLRAYALVKPGARANGDPPFDLDAAITALVDRRAGAAPRAARL